MKNPAKIIAFLTAFLCLSEMKAGNLPTPVLPESVGLNIHFTGGHQRDLDLLQAAGCRWVRMDFAWELIERKKGAYDWSAYDELTADLEKRGLRPYYILDYSNPLYEETVEEVESGSGKRQRALASPQHAQSVAAFARWAAAAAKHFLVAEVEGRRMAEVKMAGFAAALDGDRNIFAKAAITEVNSPGNHAPAPQAFKLDYEFASGWRFVRCTPINPQPAELKIRPQAIGAWVWGDNSGNQLRARFQDSSGQTFQFEGQTIDWSGWRWVSVNLDETKPSVGHWGGANDGSRHGNWHWDCPFLLDGTGIETKGTIYFCGLTLMYP